MRSRLLKFSSVKPEPGPPPAATTAAAAAQIPAVSATAAAEKVAGDPHRSSKSKSNKSARNRTSTTKTTDSSRMALEFHCPLACLLHCICHCFPAFYVCPRILENIVNSKSCHRMPLSNTQPKTAKTKQIINAHENAQSKVNNDIMIMVNDGQSLLLLRFYPKLVGT